LLIEIIEELKKEGSIAKTGLRCISREHSASPAVGSVKLHELDHEELVKKGFL
jgi:2-oxoglutarate dehydrogenase complex dehydrogenase (E1) component-like enzyme